MKVDLALGDILAMEAHSSNVFASSYPHTGQIQRAGEIVGPLLLWRIRNQHHDDPRLWFFEVLSADGHLYLIPTRNILSGQVTCTRIDRTDLSSAEV